MTHLLGHMSPEMEQCIKACEECHHICVETMMYCLQIGGKHAEASHIRLLNDCIQICHLSTDFMLRGSDYHGRMCLACAEVCENCARDCERVDSRDTQMKACADTCRRCAQFCRRMAATQTAQV
jgi:hypothetical protein